MTITQQLKTWTKIKTTKKIKNRKLKNENYYNKNE